MFPGRQPRPAPHPQLAPRNPPPVVGKGIPAPPFGRPKVDPNNPYAALEAEKAKPKPQAIRVEMSQEVVEALG